MVAISRQCHSSADEAVKIHKAVFVDQGTQLNESRNRLIDHDIRLSLCLAVLCSNFLK